MSRKQRAAILWSVFLTAIVIAVLSSTMEAQSRRVPAVPPSTQSTSTTTASVPGASKSSWDYRILTSPLSHAANTPRLQRRNVDSPPLPTFSSGARTLEEQIRELAEQGYEVQSFNVVSPACSGESDAEVVVLLRRMKK